MKRLLFPLVLAVLRWAARQKIDSVKPLIIGVTGSVGKSSFVYLLDAVLKPDHRVRTTFKGNSETGLPLEILGLRSTLTDYSPLTWLKILVMAPVAALTSRKDFDILIAEMGIDSPHPPKNMRYLLDIIQPKIGVLLAVSAAHSQQFSEVVPENTPNREAAIVEAIAQEKGLLLTSLPKTGTAIYNHDSKFITDLEPQIKAKTVTFGQGSQVDFQLRDHQVSTKGTIFTFKHQDRTYALKFSDAILFEEYGNTLLAVIAAALAVGVPIQTSIDRLVQNHPLPPGRMSLLPGQKDSLILDSSYNSSPLALSSALALLKKLKVKGQKIAVLGDMRELGPLAEDAHQQAAREASQVADVIVLVGPLMKQFCLPELEKLKYSPKSLHVFATSKGVGEFLVANILKSDDVILVKGSQNTIYLEQAIKELMIHPETAVQVLCRQGEYWDKVRADFFEETK
jgi:UDP-N-acetylmuramoyl-tripeptide--D-alanyl-D-alanine ligase